MVVVVVGASPPPPPPLPGAVDVRLGPGIVMSIEVPDLNAVDVAQVVAQARLEYRRSIVEAVMRAALQPYAHQCRSVAKPWRYREAGC